MPDGVLSAEPAWRRWVRHLPPVLGVVLLVAALTVVRKEFRHLRLEDIAAALGRIPHAWLLIAFATTIGAYLVLTVYDLLGSIYAGHRLPYRRIAFASFCAYALSHNLGVSAVSGGAVRFRLYAGWGFTPLQVGKLVGFCSVTFGFGGLVLGGGALLFEPHAMPFLGNALPPWLLRLWGALMWALVLGYLALAARGKPACWRGHELRLPRLPMALGQVLLATTDVSTTAAIFYALLPGGHHLTFLRFLAVYVMSYSAGIIASLPGGIGVFDTVMLLGLAAYMPAPRVVGAILIFRLYYYVIPLFLAGLLFSTHEVLLRGRALLRRTPAVPALAGIGHWSESDFAIAAGTGVVALCGAMLLAMGVIAPAIDAGWLDPNYSPTVVSAGHFVPSLIGAALLVLCIGLSQRVRLAWGGTIALLLLGAVDTAVSAHLRWVPGVLVLACFVLAPYRPAFHRRARLRAGVSQTATVFPLVALVACVLSLAVFERHVRYVFANSWWRIVWSQDVPGSVRLAVGLSVLVGMVALARLAWPARAMPVAWTIDTRIQYAALGGKPPYRADGLIWGEAARAALPFRRVGRVLVGMGDPAGPEADRASVIWRLREVALREGRDFAVYRVGTDLLDVYGGLGLAAVPLGPDGLPLAEQQGDGAVRPSAFLMCADGRDLSALLPALPDLAGRRASMAA
jgi:phosphatidylglycerol lysyltransferase